MKALLAGETFASVTTVAVGSQVLTQAGWSSGAKAFIAAARTGGIEIDHIGSERCSDDFPQTVADLALYDVVVISDVGALTLLVGPDTRRGRVGPNRLTVIKDFVRAGGGLLVAGGYMGFQGMFGTAGFHDTDVEDALPVLCEAGPDGVEVPEGLQALVEAPDHAIWRGIEGPMPPILGLNRVNFRGRPQSELLASCSHRGRCLPLLAVGEFGLGRSAAWTSDIGPHWLTEEFMAWAGYAPLVVNILEWLAGGRETSK
ncbi:hypothetical protein IC608_11720 [Devosia sp. PTR5]|uniref:Putative glutamine amidotransferase domain-containing protein n=1 Tax=Devosia oryzisoli TaxID=2774138 RepID=A0A927ITS8_9HYPH|nr:glutamine amidotransferase [Devosia oryzisoli]MBD8066138.1 hypothetical protein [Devosia oryzisoli]